MESKPTEIESLTMTKTYVINKYTYHMGTFTLNEKIDIFINLFSESTMIKSCVLSVRGDVYSDWGTDDNYIIEVINRNLGNLINSDGCLVIAE